MDPIALRTVTGDGPFENIAQLDLNWTIIQNAVNELIIGLNALATAKQTRMDVINISGTSESIDWEAHDGNYLRLVSSSTKSFTIDAVDTDPDFPAQCLIKNCGTGDLTIVAGSGVTITPNPDLSLVLEEGMAVTIICVNGTDAFDMIGASVEV